MCRLFDRRASLSVLGALGLAGGASAISGCGLPEAPGWLRERTAPPADQQILRLALLAEPETLDPARAAYAEEIAVVSRLYSNLLAIDARGNLVPEAAEKLPVVSADQRTLTFNLRPDLVYSDGQPLLAQDFVAGWQRFLDPRTSGEYAYLGHAIEGGEALNTSRERDPDTLGRLRAALGVRATGSRGLEFRLTGPAPWFLSVLATWCGVPIREDLAAQPSAFREPAGSIGNGAYTLREWTRGSRLILDANARYARALPTIKSVDLAIFPDAAAPLAAYQAEALDVLDLTRSSLATALGDAELARQIQRFAGPCTTFLAFNVTQPPFERSAVRQAIALTLDRAALVVDALGKFGAGARQLVPPGLPGHFDDLGGQRRDPEAARRLLASLGTAASGALASARLAYPETAQSKAVAEVVVRQLRVGLGVNVQLEPVAPRAYAAAIRAPESAPPLYLDGWCQEYPDAHSWYGSWLASTGANSSATTGTPFSTGWAAGTGWTDAEYRRLVDEAATERDTRRRATLYRNAAQRLSDQAPVAFLTHSEVVRLVRPWVSGLGKTAGERYEGQTAGPTLRILMH